MRTIAVVTTSRADYSHLYWVLKALNDHPDIQLKLLVSGAHLAPGFGSSQTEIIDDGFSIEATIEALLDSDSDVGMAKTIGVATLGFADALAKIRPDLLLVIADRYEMLAPASAAVALRIPIAHIEGGEVSEGAIDDAIRNALTQLAHLHFVSTDLARRRVMAMGEEPWRITRAGAPSLDHLTHSTLLDRSALEQVLGLDLTVRPKVISFHPVTLAKDGEKETQSLFQALEHIDGPLLFCFPNADAGHQVIIERSEAFCAQRAQAHRFINLNPVVYWSLLREAQMMIGNSSSGIMETPSLALPCVNVGQRQQGRERAANIIDVPAQLDCIQAGIETAQSSAFCQSIAGMTNPYGDGQAAQRITNVLAQCPLGHDLLLKRALELDDSEHRPRWRFPDH